MLVELMCNEIDEGEEGNDEEMFNEDEVVFHEELEDLDMEEELNASFGPKDKLYLLTTHP